MRVSFLIPMFLILLASGQRSALDAQEIRVGSKKFTEAVIIGEIITQHLEHTGVEAIHKAELGGTRLLWKALTQADLDIYADYTGTIIYEILQRQAGTSWDDLSRILAQKGIGITRPLGFNNTYALGLQPATAERFELNTISELRDHPELRFGFTNEFMDREDGWPSLRQHYGLPQKDVRGLDHDLAYRGLEQGSIDLVDLYSTDAEIAYYGLKVLDDDAGHFPEYQAVILYRLALNQEIINHLGQLAGTIDETTMTAMNSDAKIQGQPENVVAADFLARTFNRSHAIVTETRLQRLTHATLEHLLLVLLSLGTAILTAIPLGIWGARHQRGGQLILSLVGIIQTIPSLALLVFMIPLLGIGAPPALMALYLYSLLPIVRNTITGLRDIPIDIQESALVLGLPDLARLRLIELPMATRSILGGIKTSAVINVGTATLGALIGAGGYGQAILTGIRLDDTGLILEGAVPAALLALLVQACFDLVEKWLLSPGLQLPEESHS